jgi:hypothetical protein
VPDGIGFGGTGRTTRWSRQRLSALVVSRLFDFASELVQWGGPTYPALRLSFSR